MKCGTQVETAPLTSGSEQSLALPIHDRGDGAAVVCAESVFALTLHLRDAISRGQLLLWLALSSARVSRLAVLSWQLFLALQCG